MAHKQFSLSEFVGLAREMQGEPVARLQAFLARFGYLRIPVAVGAAPALAPDAPSATAGEFDAATEQALRRYQAFHGLEATGILDAATAAMMQQPRCGVPDRPSGPLAAFVAKGPWPKTSLTYAFAEASPDLSAADTRASVAAALALWENVTTLTFAEVALGANPDIVIRFAAGDHGDGYPFDGVGNILAHAFYPPPYGGGYAGDAHFDDAETWSVTLPVPAGRKDFVSVAAHEFGHSLGLDHSSVAGALMFPTYSGPHRFLHQDDIDGIRSMYPWGWDPVYLQPHGGAGIGGYDLRSAADGVITFDYDHSGKRDHVVCYRPGAGAIFIVKRNGAGFTPVYAQPHGGNGIGGYDLRGATDQVIAFDYNHTGRADHLVLYRPGAGAVFILKNNGGAFQAVYAQAHGGSGIGGYDLRVETDRLIAFDYDKSGRADHLVAYRPGYGAIFILKNNGGAFQAVYAQSHNGAGIGGYDLRSANDRIIAFDYESTGRLDHLVCYRPGFGAIFILKNNGGVFQAVYAQPHNGAGIGGYDLRSADDRIVAFDYERTGKLDHLVVYRPGFGAIFILKNNGGTFQAVYAQSHNGAGIGGYDLRSSTDLVVAFDYASTGRADHLMLCRPGAGAVFILRRE